jgi:hypothetical protein
VSLGAWVGIIEEYFGRPAVTPVWITISGTSLAWQVSMDTRYSSVRTYSVVYLLVASAFTACAGATKPTAPDTEKQRKVRADLEERTAAVTLLTCA